MIDVLRSYSEYKDSGVSWLGQIPDHWERAHGGAVLQQKKVRNRGMIEDTVLSLSYGRIVIKPPEKLHGLVPESFETYQVVDPGDIIFRPTDLQNDWTTLRVAIARDRGIITSAYLCFHARKPLTPDYAHLLLLGYDMKKVFYGMGSGLRQNLDWSDFKRLPMLVPPAEDQQAIVRYVAWLDRQVRRYIHNRRRLIEVLNEQKQVIINRAVTRGLYHDVPLKPSGIDWLGDIPKHWGRRRIKQVSKLLRGKFSHRPRNDPSLYDGPYPFIQTGDVSRAEKKVVSYSQTLNENGFAVSKQFPPGTLCMTIAANIGDVAILDFEACFPDSIIGLAPNKEIFTEYLYYVMRAMKPQLVSIAPVTAQGNLNVERVGAMSFALPPKYEQEAIAEYIVEATRSIDYTIKTATREINLINEYRTRLISDVVTGKIDVRHLAPSPGSEDLEEAAEMLEPLEDDIDDVEMDEEEEINESD